MTEAYGRIQSLANLSASTTGYASAALSKLLQHAKEQRKITGWTEYESMLRQVKDCMAECQQQGMVGLGEAAIKILHGVRFLFHHNHHHSSHGGTDTMCTNENIMNSQLVGDFMSFLILLALAELEGSSSSAVATISTTAASSVSSCGVDVSKEMKRNERMLRFMRYVECYYHQGSSENSSSRYCRTKRKDILSFMKQVLVMKSIRLLEIAANNHTHTNGSNSNSNMYALYGKESCALYQEA